MSKRELIATLLKQSNELGIIVESYSNSSGIIVKDSKRKRYYIVEKLSHFTTMVREQSDIDIVIVKTIDTCSNKEVIQLLS